MNAKSKIRRWLSAGIVFISVSSSAWLLSAAETDPRKPPAITTADVPRVPEAIFERLQQYQNVREAAFAGWSPDGRGILIRTRFGNSPQLHRVYEPGGRREQVTFFDEPCAGRFIPHATDGGLLLSMATGGNENDQVYFFDRTKSRAALLTDGKSRNGLGPVSKDGREVIIHSNQRNGRDTDLYISQCRQPGSLSPLLEVKGEHWTATDWSQDRTKLVLLRYVSANESYPALFDLATKKILPLPAVTKAPASFGAPAFAPDGKSVYLTCDARGEFHVLGRYTIATEKYDWLTDDLPGDVEEIEIESHTGTVAFTVNEQGQSKLYLLSGDKRHAATLPQGVVTGLKFSPDGKQLGFTLARSDAPADVYSLQIADDKLTQWTFSEAGGLNRADFVQPRLVQFPSFDKLKIPAFYYRPKTATREHPVPVVIDIHGGPESQYRPLFSPRAQFHALELGFACIAPNVRGSAGQGKTYLTLDNGPKREDSVQDIGALLDWIAQQPELDAKRVAVTGGSYGGYMVLASLEHFPDRLKAGVDNVGIANFITFLERTAGYRQDLRRAEYGDERDPAMRKIFERISPTANVDKIKSALLVAHGVNDPRVPFSEAQQIAEKVRQAGRPVWTVYADNEGHGFNKKDNRDYFRAVEVLFLQENLK